MDDNQDDVLTIDQWCNCGNCQEMPTRIERICCHQHETNKRLLENVTLYYNTVPFSCITQHPAFTLYCLAIEVLDENWKFDRQTYGTADGPLKKKRRHVAYCNLCRQLHTMLLGETIELFFQLVPF